MQLKTPTQLWQTDVLRFSSPNLELPWSSAVEDDKRFRRILLLVFIPFLLISLIIPFITLLEPEREELEKLPPQLARLVVEQEPPAAPPPRVVEEQPTEEAPAQEPEPEAAPPEPAPEVAPEPPPARLQQAREEAQRSGVLQFADQLAGMRDSISRVDVNTSDDNLSQGNTEAAQVDRNIVGSDATARSGGINTDDYSRDTGSVALSGKEETAVQSQMADATAAAEGARERASRDKGYRSAEEIRRQIDAARGRIYNIYNRALRSDPMLQGKVEFKLVIEPNGSVSHAEIINSELNDEDLERRLLAAVRFIDFGAADVLQTTLNYTFDFLPS